MQTTTIRQLSESGQPEGHRAGLSPTEQEALGLTWRRAAIANAAGITLMEHFQAQTDLPIVDFQMGQSLSKERIAESGSTKDWWWTDSFAQHSMQSGQLRSKLAPVGLDLEVTPSVKSDSNVVCKIGLVVHLPGRRIRGSSDVLLKSGGSVAMRNLFPVESWLPAFAYLPILGPLFTSP